MDWIEITISTNTMGADIVSEALLRQGAVGTQIIDRADVPDPSEAQRLLGADRPADDR